MTVTIDLADPATKSNMTVAMIAYFVVIAFIAYAIAEDVVALLRSKKQKDQPERRFIEPCAPDLHDYSDDSPVCRTCKAVKPVDEDPPVST